MPSRDLQQVHAKPMKTTLLGDQLPASQHPTNGTTNDTPLLQTTPQTAGGGTERYACLSAPEANLSTHAGGDEGVAVNSSSCAGPGPRFTELEVAQDSTQFPGVRQSRPCLVARQTTRHQSPTMSCDRDRPPLKRDSGLSEIKHGHADLSNQLQSRQGCFRLTRHGTCVPKCPGHRGRGACGHKATTSQFGLRWPGSGAGCSCPWQLGRGILQVVAPFLLISTG